MLWIINSHHNAVYVAVLSLKICKVICTYIKLFFCLDHNFKIVKFKKLIN